MSHLFKENSGKVITGNKLSDDSYFIRLAEDKEQYIHPFTDVNGSGYKWEKGNVGAALFHLKEATQIKKINKIEIEIVHFKKVLGNNAETT